MSQYIKYDTAHFRFNPLIALVSCCSQCRSRRQEDSVYNNDPSQDRVLFGGKRDPLMEDPVTRDLDCGAVCKSEIAD